LDWQIKHGYAPRGRTDIVLPPSEGSEGVITAHSLLTARHTRDGQIIEERVVQDRLVTDSFVQKLVNELQSSSGGIAGFKYHDSGTGTNAENAGDTSLQIPCGEARDTGSQSEGASANIYKTVATHTYSATYAITEHGVFDASSGGTLMDRSVFSAINVISGDKIEFTYEITFNSGG
jgi:hypothetical protein